MSFDIKKATRQGDLSIVGARYGRLTIKEIIKKIKWKLYVLCLCDCGKEKKIRLDHLKGGLTKSCGCLQQEVMKKRWQAMTIHGESRRRGRTKEWYVWSGMVNRCHNPASGKVYKKYGEKGIKVCDKWRKSYKFFLEDMGRIPTLKHTIERIDNNKGYSPENCKWATRREQANNRSNNHIITFKGKAFSAMEWSRLIGINSLTLIARINRGWTPEKTLTQPLLKGGNLELEKAS